MTFPILTIMISTYGDGIMNMQKTVKYIRNEICYLVIHQTEKNEDIPQYLKRNDIKVISSKTKGLSKSRNIGLRYCTTEYTLIADDDIEYIEKGIEKVINIIKTKKLDFAAFKIKTPNEDPDYKSYAIESFKIGLEKRHYFSSIELLINIDSLRKHNIYFDERFGLGTALKSGEEHILISDLVNNNLLGYYYPIYIVKHPYESSGKTKRNYNFDIFFKGTLSGRTNVYNYKTSSKNIFRKLLNYMIYFYGVLYIKLHLSEKISFK